MGEAYARVSYKTSNDEVRGFSAFVVADTQDKADEFVRKHLREPCSTFSFDQFGWQEKDAYRVFVEAKRSDVKNG